MKQYFSRAYLVGIMLKSELHCRDTTKPAMFLSMETPEVLSFVKATLEQVHMMLEPNINATSKPAITSTPSQCPFCQRISKSIKTGHIPQNHSIFRGRKVSGWSISTQEWDLSISNCWNRRLSRNKTTGWQRRQNQSSKCWWGNTYNESSIL